jgi:DNA-binding NtrC family response regulator
LSTITSEGLREIARRGAREAERKALVEILSRVQWNRVAAARMLKVSYKTLLTKITECELTPPTRQVGVPAWPAAVEAPHQPGAV